MIKKARRDLKNIQSILIHWCMINCTYIIPTGYLPIILLKGTTEEDLTPEEDDYCI